MYYGAFLKKYCIVTYITRVPCECSKLQKQALFSSGICYDRLPFKHSLSKMEYAVADTGWIIKYRYLLIK